MAAPGANHSAWSRALPQPALAGDGRLVAHQPEQERSITAPVASSDAVERDHPFGEGARLVGEEDLDVARGPRSATRRFTSTFFFARAFEPADRLTAHDGGHHLGRDADGDGQREQQGVDERPCKHDVDHEDDGVSTRGQLEQEALRSRQSGFERGLALLLGEPGGDRPNAVADPVSRPRPRRTLWTIVPMQTRTWPRRRLAVGGGRSRSCRRHRLAGEDRLRRTRARRPRAGAGRRVRGRRWEVDQSPGTSSARDLVPPVARYVSWRILLRSEAMAVRRGTR